MSLTKEQADEFWEKDMCKQKSESATIQDLYRGLKARGSSPCSEALAEAFMSLDKDGNKELSYGEFADCYKTSRSETLRKFFEDADVDKSNSLSREEFINAVRNAKCFDENTFEELLRQADTNNDGKISYSEFLATLK